MKFNKFSPCTSKPDGTTKAGGSPVAAHETTANCQAVPTTARPFSFSFADLSSQSVAIGTGGAVCAAHPPIAETPALAVSPVFKSSRRRGNQIAAYEAAMRLESTAFGQLQAEV